MVLQLDIMIISMSDFNGQLVVRFASKLCVVLLFCSCEGSDINDRLFLLMETFVQVITIIYDAVLGNF